MLNVIIIFLLACAAVCLTRVLRGPSLLDRIAAADAVGIMMIVILVLLSLVFNRTIFLDIALVYALLMFADLLIISRYLDDGNREQQ